MSIQEEEYLNDRLLKHSFLFGYKSLKDKKHLHWRGSTFRGFLHGYASERALLCPGGHT